MSSKEKYRQNHSEISHVTLYTPKTYMHSGNWVKASTSSAIASFVENSPLICFIEL